MPASAIGSRTRTPRAWSSRRALVGLERAGDGDAALDVGARLRERELEPGQRGGDVEDVEEADVADAEDLALERPLARGERDPEAVAQVEQELVAVDRPRACGRR